MSESNPNNCDTCQHKPCMDDLCHGSGCLATGSEMIPTCGKCGGPMMSDDGEPDNSGLICDDCAFQFDADDDVSEPLGDWA